MSRKKQKIKNTAATIFTILAVFITIYLLMSVYITIKGKWVVETVNNNYGIWDERIERELGGCIDRDLAERYVNYRTRGCRYDPDEWSSKEEWRSSYYEEVSACGYFFGYLTPGGAVVNYIYSQHNVSAADGSAIPNGGVNIHCKLYMKLTDLQWKVVDYYEAP